MAQNGGEIRYAELRPRGVLVGLIERSWIRFHPRISMGRNRAPNARNNPISRGSTT